MLTVDAAPAGTMQGTAAISQSGAREHTSYVWCESGHKMRERDKKEAKEERHHDKVTSADEVIGLSCLAPFLLKSSRHAERVSEMIIYEFIMNLLKHPTYLHLHYQLVTFHFRM